MEPTAERAELWPQEIRLTVCLNAALSDELRRASIEQDKPISAIIRAVLTRWALACRGSTMSIFKADPAAALTKTLDKMGAIEANIVRLREMRAERLLTTDEPSEVVNLDKAIEAENANLAILQDRVRALKEEVRKGEYAAREDQRKQAIAQLSRRLSKREAIAAELDAAIAKVGELYFQLVTPDFAAELWPTPPVTASPTSIAGPSIRRQAGLSTAGPVHMRAKSRCPLPSSARLGVTGVVAQSIAGVVRRQNQSIVSRAEMAAIRPL
jgi:hypothetical protein